MEVEGIRYGVYTVHIWYIILLHSAKVHSCCIMALWGGQAKGGDDREGVREAGEAVRRDWVNDREDKEKKETGGEDRTLRREERQMCFYCPITKMTADDNSGQLIGPICWLDRNDILYQEDAKFFYTVKQQMYRQQDWIMRKRRQNLEESTINKA